MAALAGLLGAICVVLLLVWFVRSDRGSIGRDWQQVEQDTAAWLRAVGCRQVAMTTAGADGGVDVLTSDWAVQVKHTERRVGRPAVQQIVGAALHVARRPAVVSTSGFTSPAVEYAVEHDVALIRLDEDGRGRPVTSAAREIGDERRRGVVGSVLAALRWIVRRLRRRSR